MNYLILVSHGNFAEGLHHALTMFVGERDDIKSIGLKSGEDVDSLAQQMRQMLDAFQAEDQFMVLGDLIGGSPLTTMMNCLAEKGLMKNAVILGGMNLAMALNAALMKEDLANGKNIALQEGMQAMKELQLTEDDEDDI